MSKMVWSTTLSPAEFIQALDDARAAERARILAALPEALHTAMVNEGLARHWSWRCEYPDKGEEPCDFTDEAAALVAAIERVLEEEPID